MALPNTLSSAEIRAGSVKSAPVAAYYPARPRGPCGSLVGSGKMLLTHFCNRPSTRVPTKRSVDSRAARVPDLATSHASRPRWKTSAHDSSGTSFDDEATSFGCHHHRLDALRNRGFSSGRPGSAARSWRVPRIDGPSGSALVEGVIFPRIELVNRPLTPLSCPCRDRRRSNARVVEHQARFCHHLVKGNDSPGPRRLPSMCALSAPLARDFDEGLSPFARLCHRTAAFCTPSPFEFSRG